MHNHELSDVAKVQRVYGISRVLVLRMRKYCAILYLPRSFPGSYRSIPNPLLHSPFPANRLRTGPLHSHQGSSRKNGPDVIHLEPAMCPARSSRLCSWWIYVCGSSCKSPLRDTWFFVQGRGFPLFVFLGSGLLGSLGATLLRKSWEVVVEYPICV